MADGSTQYLSENIDHELLVTLTTRAAGDIPSQEAF
jgi:hypothetical protein